MADVPVTASTFISRNVAVGNSFRWVGDYAATTAAGADTVATPLSVVDSVSVSFATAGSSSAPTTATICQAYLSTLAGSILVATSTHNNLSVRYTVTGH